jgi:hypothetical protein
LPNLTLLDLFRAYPGGVAALSEQSGVAQHTIYRVANGTHSRVPLRALSALSEVLAAQPLLGETWRFDRVASKWEDAHSRTVATAG